MKSLQQGDNVVRPFDRAERASVPLTLRVKYSAASSGWCALNTRSM